VFKKVRLWSLSCARRIQFTPFHPISLRFIPILSSHLLMVLPRGLFPSDWLYLPTNGLQLQQTLSMFVSLLTPDPTLMSAGSKKGWRNIRSKCPTCPVRISNTNLFYQLNKFYKFKTGLFESACWPFPPTSIYLHTEHRQTDRQTNGRFVSEGKNKVKTCKVVLVLNQVPRHGDLLGEWRYKSMHS
jgi:hypothetical protein